MKGNGGWKVGCGSRPMDGWMDDWMGGRVGIDRSG